MDMNPFGGGPVNASRMARQVRHRCSGVDESFL